MIKNESIIIKNMADRPIRGAIPNSGEIEVTARVEWKKIRIKYF